MRAPVTSTAIPVAIAFFIFHPPPLALNQQANHRQHLGSHCDDIVDHTTICAPPFAIHALQVLMVGTLMGSRLRLEQSSGAVIVLGSRVADDLTQSAVAAFRPGPA